VSCLVLAGVLTGIVLLAYNHLYLREISFFGNRHLTYEELLSLSGCTRQSRLFSVSTGSIYRGLRKSPWIKEAMVRRDLTGRVNVRITEAVPVAVLSDGEKSYLIDREGVRLEEIRQEPAYFLPVIKIDPASCKEAYKEAVVLASLLYEGKMTTRGGNIELSGTRPEDITMLADNVPVRIGSGDFARKLEKLDFVREEITRRNMTVEYIDLRFLDKIVVKPLKQEGKDSGHAVSRAVGHETKKPKPTAEKKKNSAKKVTGRRSAGHVG